MTATLVEGAKAPAFKLPTDDGGSVTLADFKGKNLVLFFYPKADTPGCTREAIAFSELKPAFTKANTEVVGVSADKAKAQGAFKKKHNLKTALASDETHKMLEAYGVWGEKSMYGRDLPGHYPDDCPDRAGRAHRTRMAQGESRRARRRGARSGARPQRVKAAFAVH